MSFDKEIRNALAKMVTACRRTLTEDVTNQLQETFGLYPDTSLPLDRLTHLTWDEAEAAQALREQLDHFAAVESGRPEERRRSAYDRLILEIAFTILNRLAALRLCEDRELVIECVRKGTASDGFRLFNSISGGALGSIHETYRIFLECMMDELALDLGVLFDRTNPQSAVFPTERCLKEIFNLLNDPDLSFVWSEDETIGWIYQYFNPPEERRAMREASQAPRNSRELAVRNQFFTPRYVVEFLTDNTLGRIWYEMRKRKTSLVEQCRYLVRRPNEIFLDLGEEPPVEDDHEKDFSQEELLKRPCYILHRPKKDPRDIKSLDPACGSAHFLLYDFDLMETIYVEAWNDPESPASEATGRTLLEDYPTLDVLRRALPELILRHNLHGIDIDVRAVQIAAFALWLRAQRSWKAQEIKAKDRPRVTKSNIICAEPMPGENDMLREFTESIQPELLGQLVEKIFEKMKMAGEAGSLLKIEEDIHEAVTDANRRWIQGIKQTMQTQLKSDQEYIKPSHRPSSRARVGEDFWDVAENHIIEALREYAENAENGKTLSRRLFTDDAASGFALIDLFRKRFDVLLMNPPFGEYPETFKALSKIQYNSGGHDILTAFIERGLATCAKNGLLGAITSRTVFFMPTTKEWRKKIILQRQNLLWIELGEGVLDEAMVETCVYVVQNSSPYLPCLFINPSSIPLDQIISGFNLHNFIENVIYYLDQRKFETIEGSPLAYWIAPKMLECYNKLPSLEDKGINVRVGLQTGDDFRFIRCWWEIPIGLETWIPHSKGGENLPYATDIHLVINWKNNGNEMRAQESIRLNMYAKHDPCEGLDPGLTFSYRTHRFSPAIMPSGVIAGVAGMGVFSEKFELFLLLALLNTSVVNEFIETRLGLQKINALYQAGTISPIPFPIMSKEVESSLSELGKELWRLCSYRFLFHEENRAFCPPLLNCVQSLKSWITTNKVHWKEIRKAILENYQLVDGITCNAYGLPQKLAEEIAKKHLPQFELSFMNCELTEIDFAHFVISYALGVIFGRWDIRIPLGQSLKLKQTDPMDPLPIYPPGMLIGDSLSAKPKPYEMTNENYLKARFIANIIPQEREAKILAISDSLYPLEISLNGILVGDYSRFDEQSPRDDIIRRVQEVLGLIWGDQSQTIEQEACQILDVSDLQDYFRRPSGFFQDHLKRYSKSRRKAPIYWPLSTASGSYTIWLYYHLLNDQTLYAAVNDYLEPKISELERDLSRAEEKLKAASGRDANLIRDKIDEGRTQLAELKDLRQEILRIAALPYKPDLNDGVIINAAPFHKLFRLRSWAEDTEEVWNKLERGEYDWSHLAYVLWPDRVKEACRKDRSIAIAHSLEDICQTPAPSSGKGTRARRGRRSGRAA